MEIRTAGWYPDPQDENNMRYWDGVEWTTRTTPMHKSGLTTPSATEPDDNPADSSATSENNATTSASRGDTIGGVPTFQPLHAPGTKVRAVPGPEVIANPGYRVLAYLIDSILINSVGIIVTLPWLLEIVAKLPKNPSMESLVRVASTPLPAIVPIIVFCLAVVYETIFVKITGRTPGKMVLGMTIKNTNEKPLNWMQSFTRAAVKHSSQLGALNAVLGLLLNAVLFISFALIWVSNKSQALHDLLIPSKVVAKGPVTYEVVDENPS